MTDAAVSIHQQVVQEGIEVDSDEYYNEVNSRIGKYHQITGSNIAKKLGVPLEEYAKYVKEDK